MTEHSNFCDAPVGLCLMADKYRALIKALEEIKDNADRCDHRWAAEVAKAALLEYRSQF